MSKFVIRRSGFWRNNEQNPSLGGRFALLALLDRLPKLFEDVISIEQFAALCLSSAFS